MARCSDYEPDLVCSQPNLDREWLKISYIVGTSSPQTLYNWYDKLNAWAPQSLTQDEWTMLSRFATYVIHQALHQHIKE